MTETIARVTRSVISGPDTQTAIWFLGALSQLRVTGDQTGGALAVADHLARRGNASPVHVHDRDDETFFVLDGELRVLVGEEEPTAGPGTAAVLPRRVSHAYVVTSATARFLTLHTRPGSSSSPPRSVSLPKPSRCRRHRLDHRTPPRWPRPPRGTRSRSWLRRPSPRTTRWWVVTGCLLGSECAGGRPPRRPAPPTRTAHRRRRAPSPSRTWP